VNKHRHRLALVLSLGFLLLLAEAQLPTYRPLADAYTPAPGHWTLYDYGFVNTLPNRTGDEIHDWTALNLTGGGYTLQWHQYVNLSISVAAVAVVLNVMHVLYDFSVIVHSNCATISNGSWQTTVTLNGSTLAPAPTGVSSGPVDLPVYQGLPGFFLDDLALTTMHAGFNVNIGGSPWQSVVLDTFALNGQGQACYVLHNVTTTATTSIDTTYGIDQDVGIFFYANETRALAYGGVTQILTYYYTVLATTVPLTPPPNPLLVLLVVTIAAIALAIVAALFGRALWRRRRRSRLESSSETQH
jgi:hypothetical protein